jgi:hypothetical protein
MTGTGPVLSCSTTKLARVEIAAFAMVTCGTTLYSDFHT